MTKDIQPSKPKVELCVCQSSVAAMEPFLSQEVSCCCEISDILLVGNHLGVPQHSHHRLGALQPTRLVD